MAPRTREEEVLAGIWTEVLGTGPIGVQDNFFLLGGDSLRATLVVSRITNVFGVELRQAALFETPTLGDMSKAIARHKAATADPEKVLRILSEVEGMSEEESRKLVEK